MRPRRRRSPGCVAVVARDLHRVPCLTIAWSTLLAGLFTALNAEPTAFGCGRPATDRRAPGEFSELSRTRRTALGQDGVLGVYASAGHTMNVDQDFAEFVAARWTALYRLAYLLTASPAAAEDLLQTSLEKAYVRWARIVGMEHTEAYVRRMIANTYLSSRRR